MNRIELSSRRPGGTPQAHSAVGALSLADIPAPFRSAAASTLRYHLFMPLHYEPNYAYPLVIWLHGPDDHERQLGRVMPGLSVRNYAAIAPRGTRRSHPQSALLTWGDSPEEVQLAEQYVSECLEIASQKLHINPEHVFLAGLGCGGSMALRIGARQPRLFAGLVSLGGAFPEEPGILTNLSRLRQCPLFLTQGRDAEGYTVDQLCENLQLFHAAGISATVRQYPTGDELTTQMLRDLDHWLMERVTGQTTTEASTMDSSRCPLN
ncbi:MAG: alpha/beta hydrolase [Planctomycetota bacterium]